MTDEPNIEPVDLSPTREELIARVRARGRQIRTRRRVALTFLATVVVVVGLAIPAIAIGSKVGSESITPATAAPARHGDFRIAVVVGATPVGTGGSCPGLSDDAYCYELGRTLVTAADVRGAKVRYDSTHGWAVEVKLSASGAHRLATGGAGHQAAIIVGDRVLSAPTIESGITGTAVEVAPQTGFSHAQAIAVAAAILGTRSTASTTTNPTPVGDLTVQPILEAASADAPCTLPAAGRTCLPLGPTLVDATSVRDVAVFYDEPHQQWALRITFDPAAAQILAAQTGEVEFVVGGYVQSGASMPQGLAGDDVVIAPYTDRAGDITIATKILGHAPTHVEYRALTASIALAGGPALTAGLPMPGELVVINYSSKPLRVRTDAHGCRLPWIVELTNNGSVPIGPPPERVDCQPTFALSPGENRIPFTMRTTYASCNAQPFGDEVACLPGGGLPPLPAGSYTAVLQPVGLFPTTTPVAVQLVSANP